MYKTLNEVTAMLKVTTIKGDEDGWTCMVQLPLLDLKRALATHDTIDMLVGAKVLPHYDNTEMEWYTEGHGVHEDITFLVKTEARANQFVSDFLAYFTKTESERNQRLLKAATRKRELTQAMADMESLNERMTKMGFSVYDRDFTKVEMVLDEALGELDWLVL